jgi:uncharacterized membrane protein YgdD (TMEM256/DUF423 family)
VAGSVLIALAGLRGAAGVALAAAAAHAAAGTGLDSAAFMLMAHAAALVALAVALDRRLLSRPLALVGAAGLIAGQVLFAADMAMRAFAHDRLFPAAAPIGGTLTILAWLFVTLAAIVAATKRQS